MTTKTTTTYLFVALKPEVAIRGLTTPTGFGFECISKIEAHDDGTLTLHTPWDSEEFQPATVKAEDVARIEVMEFPGGRTS